MTEEMYQNMLGQAEREIQGRVDVVTLAQSCRAGEARIQINPTSNGFLVTIDSPVTNDHLVYTKAGDVGLLIRTLLSSNLENVDVIKRLRRLMGYK